MPERSYPQKYTLRKAVGNKFTFNTNGFIGSNHEKIQIFLSFHQ